MHPAPSSSHDFECLGGAGGWEVWECVRCKRRSIPTPFGFLWPNLAAWLWPKRWGCGATAPSTEDRAIYAAARVHAAHRGIDLSEWPNPQALGPDEFRWMRDAIATYRAVAGEKPAP